MTSLTPSQLATLPQIPQVAETKVEDIRALVRLGLARAELVQVKVMGKTRHEIKIALTAIGVVVADAATKATEV